MMTDKHNQYGVILDTIILIVVSISFVLSMARRESDFFTNVLSVVILTVHLVYFVESSKKTHGNVVSIMYIVSLTLIAYHIEKGF